MGWTNDSFKLASELKGSERSQALCDNKIDAFIYMVGHPNGSIKNADFLWCKTGFQQQVHRSIEYTVAENPYYAYSTVPAGMYRGTDADVNSFGVAATMVTTSDVSDEVAYNVAKAVFENFATFKRLHPAFCESEEEDMDKAGISILFTLAQ